MKSNQIIIIVFFSFCTLYPQTKNHNELNLKKSERIMRSYISAGFGRTSDYLNLGGGLFFPLTKNLLIGPRANENVEMQTLKTPLENMFDIEIELKFIPYLSRWVMFSIGAGAGYSIYNKRGKLIEDNFFLLPKYEKINSSSLSCIAELGTSLFITNHFGINVSTYSVITKDKAIFRYQLSLLFCKISITK